MPIRLSPARIAAIGLIAALPFGLAACDTVSDALGIGKTSPDEYAVAPQRPLVMPPDYNLRAPQPGATGPADINARGVAARAVATSGESAAAAPGPKVKAQPVPAVVTTPEAPPPTASTPEPSSNVPDTTTGRVLSTTPEGH